MKISIPIPSHAQLHGGGFEAGFLHPVLGFDHLLAMVAVGIIATQIGGRANYLVPFSFVFVMFLGALFGFEGVSLYDEQGIAFSVFFLGLIIALNKKIPLLIAMVFVGFFAFFHGHAHGVELPRVGSKRDYILGFVFATIVLHLLGVFFGYMSKKIKYGSTFLSHIGSAMAGIGLYILIKG